MTAKQPVMWRDASFWKNANTTAPKKAHYVHPTRTGPYGGPTALCSGRIMLNEETECFDEQVPNSICERCQTIQGKRKGDET